MYMGHLSTGMLLTVDRREPVGMARGGCWAPVGRTRAHPLSPPAPVPFQLSISTEGLCAAPAGQEPDRPVDGQAVCSTNPGGIAVVRDCSPALDLRGGKDAGLTHVAGTGADPMDPVGETPDLGGLVKGDDLHPVEFQCGVERRMPLHAGPELVQDHARGRAPTAPGLLTVPGLLRRAAAGPRE